MPSEQNEIRLPEDEAITLPRSGVVLKLRGFRYSIHDDSGTWRAGIRDDPWEFGPVKSQGKWSVWINGLTMHVGSRDECISWLDSRVLELRAALSPTMPDRREIVANALIAEWLKDSRYTLNSTPSQATIDAALRQADAVLSALAAAEAAEAVDPATAPIAEVREELARRGIDVKPALAKVLAAVHAKDCRTCGGTGKLPCNTVMCKDKPEHPCPDCEPSPPEPVACGTCGYSLHPAESRGGTIREHEQGCRYYEDPVTRQTFDLDGSCQWCLPERKPCPRCAPVKP